MEKYGDNRACLTENSDSRQEPGVDTWCRQFSAEWKAEPAEKEVVTMGAN